MIKPYVTDNGELRYPIFIVKDKDKFVKEQMAEILAVLNDEKEEKEE